MDFGTLFTYFRNIFHQYFPTWITWDMADMAIFFQVRISATAQRATDPSYGLGETAFSDGFPVLVSSTASVALVARKVPLELRHGMGEPMGNKWRWW